MFRLIPAPLHRGGLIAAHRMRRVWWRLRKPLLTGCRVLALDGAGRVLLVRHSYGSGRWMLPGGGLARGEDPVAAALRELGEEVGCGLLQPLHIATIEEPLSGTTNRVHLICGMADGLLRADGREIVEVRFFALESLPVDVSPTVALGLPGWVKKAEAVLSFEPVEE
ncbi:NUDIX domain-containing protein [Novosphingobium sp.]|uniref:NUDIX domain-containing protein n=1 Tax=Novosphingobium sp. TaxID=1874826 RepID=UPI0025FCB72D|nr:NUDIX domain-containing protein [Novosphingobium sp.]